MYINLLAKEFFIYYRELQILFNSCLAHLAPHIVSMIVPPIYACMSIVLSSLLLLLCFACIEVLDVVVFLVSHNLAGESERVTVSYSTLSPHYDQLRHPGGTKYVHVSGLEYYWYV